MDGGRFDALTHSLRSMATRRTTSRALVGGFGLLGLVADRDADAKKKKKKCKKPKVKCGKKCCDPPCAFDKTATTWTLKANCTTKTRIEIPDGVTLDGDGKTITMTGDIDGYLKSFGSFVLAPAVLAAGGAGNVRDLTIKGQGMTSDSFADPEGIVFVDTGGAIENVTISDVAISGVGFGIDLILGGGQTVTIEHATVSGSSSGISVAGGSVQISGADVTGGSIVLGGPVTATVADSTVKGLPGSGAIVIRGDAEVTVEDSAIETGFICVQILGEGSAPTKATLKRNTIENCQGGAVAFNVGSSGNGVFVAEDNTLSGVEVGLGVGGSGWSGAFTGNTIVGPGAVSVDRRVAGLGWSDSATGSASGNTISGFFNDFSGQTGCGISIAADAGEVAIGANTFPDPPGNEQNVCDNRP